MALVSVIIPTYNGEQYILDAVNSALQQTHAPMEIIVVDDGSQEDILRILSPVSSCITYIRQDNAGPAAARNRGIRAAHGEFIAFLDDDDLWHPAKIEVQMRWMHQDPDCGLVYSFPTQIDERGSILSNGIPDCPSGNAYYDLLRSSPIITPSVTLLRASVLENTGYFDESVYIWEDYDLWLRISKAYSVRYCSDAVIYYRQTNSGISKNYYRFVYGYLHLMRKLLEEFINSWINHDEAFIDAIGENLHTNYRYFAYKLYFEKDDRANAKQFLAAALRKRLWNLKDILFLIWFSLPKNSFEHVRNFKRAFCGHKKRTPLDISR
jgi:glycosyltransferase involved in cell wall biosynthesis